MKRIMIVLVCMFMLVGCGQRWIYTKNGVPYNQTSDWSKDQRECRFEAEKVAATHSNMTNNIVAYKSVYDSCMEYKGWQKVYLND